MESADHLFLVYFFYGLSFLVLGVLLIAQHPQWSVAERIGVPHPQDPASPGTLVENLWFLGMFAILHGLNEWVDMSLMSDAWTRLEGVMQLASSFLYAMSTLCLFEFGISLMTATRKHLAWLRWIPLGVFFFWLITLFLGALLHWEMPNLLLETRGWVRYCFGLAGGLLIGFALLSQRELLASATPEGASTDRASTARRLRKLLIVAAIFFGINAFLSTVMAAESSLVDFSATHGPLRDLLLRIGLNSPLALFRAACAVVICFSVIQALLAIDREQSRQLLSHQKELEEANERLRLSYEQLKETQQQLVHSEKMSAVGTLVSGIAHEFNNILSGLKGYTQLARSSNDLEQIHRDLEVIEEAANRTIEITSNLLSWVRPERRREEFVDPNEVIRQAISLVQTTFSKRNIKLDVSLDSVSGVPLSKAEVQDIVMNLIINASHAIEREDGLIRVTCRLSDPHTVELMVEDNGKGIESELLDKIFLPFFTTKGALGASDTPGTGLGLYVVYGIIRNAGGDIRVESTVGGASSGTRFIITLPAQDRIWQQMTEPENPDVDAEAVALLSKMSVLVVEDELLIRDALRRYLHPRAQHVSAAENGREALKLAADRRFDLIFLDMLMPGINGLETLRRLRELSPDTPVILMTGKPERNIREQVMSRGAADLIRKPFDLTEIAPIVRRVARVPVRRSIA
jgi:signal transduction histidine kinase/ActR/RegA family two-component response regulator